MKNGQSWEEKFELKVVNWGKLSKVYSLGFVLVPLCLQRFLPGIRKAPLTWGSYDLFQGRWGRSESPFRICHLPWNSHYVKEPYFGDSMFWTPSVFRKFKLNNWLSFISCFVLLLSIIMWSLSIFWKLHIFIGSTAFYLWFYHNLTIASSCVLLKFVCVSHSVVSNSLWPHGLSLPGSSVHGILQARILEWVAMPFSWGSSRSRDWTWVSCIAFGFFTHQSHREALLKFILIEI